MTVLEFRTREMLPLWQRQGDYIVVGCMHNPDPSIRVFCPPGSDEMQAITIALREVFCHLMRHTGRDERKVEEADGRQRWYVYRNDLGRICREGCKEVHPYLMVEHQVYADTTQESPLPGCTPELARPGFEVAIREVQDGCQEHGWRAEYVLRRFRVPEGNDVAPIQPE